MSILIIWSWDSQVEDVEAFSGELSKRIQVAIEHLQTEKTNMAQTRCSNEDLPILEEHDPLAAFKLDVKQFLTEIED